MRELSVVITRNIEAKLRVAGADGACKCFRQDYNAQEIIDHPANS